MNSTIRNQFILDKSVTFLNHGSFGACPKPVFDDYQRWQKKLEEQPVLFSTEILYEQLSKSRIALGNFVGCDDQDLIFFQNPTTAVSNIIFSLDLEPGDEVLMSDHEYGALVRAWSKWGLRNQVKIIEKEITLPVTNHEKFIEDVWEGVGPRTKVIFLSQITSFTALEFPVKDLCRLARDKGIYTIIDGAHVPGHIDLNINELDCDFYTGACHKWLCAPKGTSFLFVKKEHQKWIRPLVYSWGKEGDDPEPSEFLQDFQWQGTRDMASFLTLPKAIEFFKNYIESERLNCKKLIRETAIELAELFNTPSIYSSFDWINQMVSQPIPQNAPQDIKKRLWNKYKIEIPTFHWRGQKFIRVSCNVYNNAQQMEYLLNALRSLI
ncbi:MAG: aminotransferase [Candidatus Marinimicrobia bacterium]|nr:aminotransferase [Candidatus Neomarinimicrobiota bacterium]